MVELITESRMAIDDLVNAMGRPTIETVLQLSADQVAGPPQQGRRRLTVRLVRHSQRKRKETDSRTYGATAPVLSTLPRA